MKFEAGHETWHYVAKGDKFGPYFSRSDLDEALRAAGLSAGRGYALIRETGSRGYFAADFDCDDCDNRFETLCTVAEAAEVSCPQCGSKDVKQALSAPHVGNPGILLEGSKRSEQDELRFRRLRLERQSMGLPWQKRGEHQQEMANLSVAANKAEGKTP